MTFDDLWKALLAKNGKLANDEAEVVLKAGNLKKLLEQVYDQGKKAGKDLQKAVDRFMDKGGKDPMDLFTSFFGKK